MDLEIIVTEYAQFEAERRQIAEDLIKTSKIDKYWHQEVKP